MSCSPRALRPEHSRPFGDIDHFDKDCDRVISAIDTVSLSYPTGGVDGRAALRVQGCASSCHR